MSHKTQMMHPKEFGQEIERIRKRGGFSRKELATIAGVGSTAIYELEKGTGKTKLITILNILNALNTKLFLKAPFIDTSFKEIK